MNYTLGIDGGGTKTDAVILDEAGNVVGAGVAGGCNANFVSRRVAVAAYKRAIRAAIKQANIEPSCINRAACTFGGVADEAFGELGIAARARHIGEHRVAFERAGIHELRGVGLVAGTGSSCVALEGGERVTSAGGWGPLLGDEGSAYDIGLSAIKRALLACEGRAPGTLLEQAVRGYFGVERTKGAIGKLCGLKINQSLVAGFAVEVSKAANEGDEAAIEIIESAGEVLGELAAFVARRIFTEEDDFPFVLAGGVFNIGRLVIDPIKAVLRPQFPKSRIVVAEMRPGEAVARLAMRDVEGERADTGLFRGHFGQNQRDSRR